MNAFYEPHKNSIEFGYRCFDRLLLNGLIQLAVILKGREPARILVAIGGKDNDSPHLEYRQPWVNQYNFYLNDKHWGPMFVRMCPYFPFSARVCLNQHYWLATRMRQQKIDFQQCKNAFLRCSHPEQLAGIGRFAHRTRYPAVRSQVAGRIHSVLHGTRTPRSHLSTPAILRASRVLRQPDIFPARSGG